MKITDLYDTDNEKNVIGCCLVELDVLGEVRNILSANDFGTGDHTRIFSAMCHVADHYENYDTVSVADHLKRVGELNRSGGTDYLYDLQSVIVETESAKSSAEIVKGFSTRRQIITSCKGIIGNAENYNVPVDDILNELYEEAESINHGHRNEFEIITAFELSQMQFPPVKWLIPNLLSTGVTLLAGPAKIGKSYMCWNIALAVAMGGIAFSAINVEEKRNVLYLALDDNIELIQDRHKALLEGETAPKNLHMFTNQNEVKFDTAGLRKLEHFIDTNNIELIIADTLTHVKPSAIVARNKTAYDIDYEALIPIQRFAHNKKIGIILVTHTTKGQDLDNPFNQIQGSSGIQAGCDNMFMLTRSKAEGGHCELQTTGRRIHAVDYAVEKLDGGHWKIIGEADTFIGNSAEANDVLKVLESANGEPVTPKEIAEAVDITVNTATQRIKRLLDKCEIVKVSRGKYIHANYNHNLDGIEL